LAALRDPACAEIVAQAIMFHNEERYALSAWCVMPNHVHVLLVTRREFELGQVVRSWKRYTANRINEVLARRGRLWAADYFDRYVRDEAHFQATKRYIEMNPVVAGLCTRPEDWRFGSAGWSV
jgi:REP element-mobilizing transposase RayT